MQTATEFRAQLRVEASPELRRRLKMRAAERGVSMQRYAAEAIEEKLAEDAEDRAENQKR